MKKIAACLFLAAGLTGLFAQTNSPAVRPLSLTDCFAEALKHNLDVQVQRYEPQISLYDLRAAYGGYDPVLNLSGQYDYNRSGGFFPTNPVPITQNNTFKSDLGGSLPSGTTYDLFGNVLDTYGSSPENSGGQIGVSVTQPLLKNFWVDNTRLTISIAKNRLQFSEQGLRQQIIATVTAVENAYYELIYARENVKVQQEALTLAETQLHDDNQRVKVGTVAQSGGTLEQDEAQVAQSRANLIAAENTLSVDENTLKSLLTDNYPQWHAVAIEPTETLQAAQQPFDLQDSWGKGLTQRPDLLQARLNVEQQGIQLRYDRNQIFPQLDLVGSFGYNGAGHEFNNTFDQYGAASRPFYSYGAQLSIPLSNVKARNNLKSGRATEKQLLLTLKQFEQKVMVEIDNAVNSAKSAWESVDATQKARTYAEAALKAEQGKYAAGKSTTFTVLQLQNNLTAARSQEIRALANYEEALANLAQQEGSTIQRRHLEIQAR
jgi:HAE1 family hydrophobic/amphiphilic exporter-1